MSTKVPAVYVASRASVPERPAMWRALRENGWNITSSWIDESGEGETGCFSELWARVTREISISDMLILYAEQDDFPLKGALVEVGIAIGMNKPVAVVLQNCDLEDRTMRPLGSWINHPLCRMFDALKEAYDWKKRNHWQKA